MGKIISIILAAIMIIVFVSFWEKASDANIEERVGAEYSISDESSAPLSSEDSKDIETTEDTTAVEEPVETKTGIPDKKVIMFFGGDVNLDQGYTNIEVYLDNERNIEQCFSSQLVQYLNSGDVFMLNSTFAFTDSRDFISKRYTFRADPENVDFYEKLGVDIVSLANNHVCDYGDTGLLDTLRTFDAHGISSVGAGMDLDEASRPYYLYINGIRIAFVSAMCSEKTIVTPEATESTAGVMKMYELEPFLGVVSEAREKADFVVVYAHWGLENSLVLETEQTTAAHALVDAGADVVIGSHTHTLQEVEYYNGKPIFYSLGDFWNSSVKSETAIIRVIINADGSIQYSLIPCDAGESYTAIASADSARTMIERLNLSETVSISADGTVTEK